ncbi:MULTISPECIES: 3'-5' exonuclease [Caproicibacterium]|jgi:DNA polymerase III epsilon subunit-like protein|uniref:Exonuclease n=1 Tax=Caproicibacterium lactatifermentans TaxID=2666138 RepID=A0A859DQK3_9FIRM|nr:3'-5' exonuclease [Caproicibacterium lactatifermentans]ARP50544.1 exonuclease [Ruminococcaceae bacterium CPB6]MDD4807831.1 exonuclease domain-containing protein [Oscillospiraceae bacterium]QKN23735.1 exonuclease [Caproicibacterium lactatifermentans]QKO29630.1 exonuclease [Caproicibacterium lactatifermentans]
MKPIVILDLEWNGTYSRRLKGFINEIIEFGAVKVDDSLQRMDTFSMLVRPQVGKKISEKIAELTSITDEDLEHGGRFMQVVSRFRRWAGDCLLMTWGTSDIQALIENCRYFNGSDRIPFLEEYVDLQAYCEKCLSYKKGQQIGLSTAAEMLNISEETFDHHRALDDSLLSLQCLRKLYRPDRMRPFVQNARTKDFYDRMEFRTVILCDLDNPLVKQTNMDFDCPVCGAAAQRQTAWSLHNKSFHAVFHCSVCGRAFHARMQFKLKYEGLSVRRTTHLLQLKENAEHTEKSNDLNGTESL